MSWSFCLPDVSQRGHVCRTTECNAARTNPPNSWREPFTRLSWAGRCQYNRGPTRYFTGVVPPAKTWGVAKWQRASPSKKGPGVKQTRGLEFPLWTMEKSESR